MSRSFAELDDTLAIAAQVRVEVRAPLSHPCQCVTIRQGLRSLRKGAEARVAQTTFDDAGPPAVWRPPRGRDDRVRGRPARAGGAEHAGPCGVVMRGGSCVANAVVASGAVTKR